MVQSPNSASPTDNVLSISRGSLSPLRLWCSGRAWLGPRPRRFWWYEKEKKKKRWLDRSVALHSAIPDHWHWQPEPNATRVRVQVLSPFQVIDSPPVPVTSCHPTNLPDLFRRLGRFSQSGQEAWMIMTARMYMLLYVPSNFFICS